MSVLNETKIHLRVNVNRKSHIAGSSNKWNLYTYIFDIFYKCNTCYFVTWLMTIVVRIRYNILMQFSYLTYIHQIWHILISYSWKASMVKRELRVMYHGANILKQNNSQIVIYMNDVLLAECICILLFIHHKIKIL